MTRFKAAAIHLGISVLVVGSVFLALTLLWYPPELWRMAKVGGLVALLAGVDMALGPLLTLMVFKSGKPSLRFDLTTIALLQLAGLAYGSYILFQSRPVFIVATVERFQLVFAVDIEPADLGAGAPGFTTLGWAAPRIVGATPSQDPKSSSVGVLNLLEGKTIAITPRNYVDYDQIARILLGSATPVKEDPATAFERELLGKVRARDLDPSKVVYMDLVSGRGAAVMLLKADDGAVIGPLDVDPATR